jgi:hypothetical protein
MTSRYRSSGGHVSQSPLVSPGNGVPAVSRRSTRIEKSVPLIILGKNRMGEPFMERTVAVSLNKHGCRYASRHDYGVGTWITLQVVGLISPEEKPASVRAVVRTIYPPASSRELQQVGVELETPSNVWGIVQPPSDWASSTETEASAYQQATAPTLVDESLVESESNNGAASKAIPKLADVTAFPAPVTPEPTKSHEAHRVVVTSEGLMAALQGKFQHEAEKAVQAALAKQMDGAVREALGSIESARQSSLQEMRELLSNQIKAPGLTLKEDSSTEATPPWKEETERHRSRTEQIAERMEEQAAELKRELASTREQVEKLLRERPVQVNHWNDAPTQATSDFEKTATQMMERRYERLREDVQTITQEALLKLNARMTEAQALVQGTVNSSLEELQRGTQSHLNMVLAETKERAGSALASLNAENRASWDARIQTVQTEMARFAECATEQFQNSMKGFLYSCLVAAVGAVDEHAQATFQGLKQEVTSSDDGYGGAKVNEPKILGDSSDDSPSQ